MGRLIAQIPNEDRERLSRIMDAKYRVIGVDTQALKTQHCERQAAEQAEKTRDLQYARLAKHYDDQIALQEQAAVAAQAAVSEADARFRSTYQQRDGRREWDLNRPDALTIDRPAREGDDDARCGASSLQRFDGEDLSAGARSGAQMAQCKEWWEQQARERAALAAHERGAQAAADALIAYCDDVQQSARRAEADAARAANLRTLADNSTLAESRRAAAAADAAWERSMAQHETESMLASAVLAEAPGQAASALAGGRVRGDHWKGMSPTQKQAILDEQFRQVEELKAKRQAAVAAEALWARTSQDTDAAVRERQRLADDFRRQQAAAQLAFQQEQAAAKRARDAALNETYANKIAPEFFSQFGTSHR